MGFFRRLLLTGTVFCAVLAGAASARAESMDDLAPYKMIRSLQFVQDTVVLGDHSAMEMQRFLLSTIDERLRTADSAIFDDPRNVDAALVYAMSGGNPETLELLIKKDIAGHFDSRLTDALRGYLGGRGTQSVKSLAEIFPEYKRSKVGPYLALVSANSVIRKDPKLALSYFDWARLVAPGTIVEEAALRRSIYIAVRRNFLTPMFTAFDYPTPFSTMGRRSVSNVPAQALTMLNNPLVVQQAELWAKRILAEPMRTPAERVERMFLMALSRPPTDAERTRALAFVQADSPASWTELAHVLFNLKEFIYVQ